MVPWERGRLARFGLMAGLMSALAERPVSIPSSSGLWLERYYHADILRPHRQFLTGLPSRHSLSIRVPSGIVKTPRPWYFPLWNQPL